MTNVEKVLGIAREEIGNKEDPQGKVKYNIEYGLIDAWCVMFIWWVFKKAGLSKIFFNGKKVASCTTLYEKWAYPERLDVPIDKIQPGDLIIFQFGSNRHIGICESFDGTWVTTIDGNTCEDGKEWDGMSVMRRKRHRNLIKWVIRPKYTITKPNNPEYHIVKKGEWFTKIAAQYGLSYDQLKKLNPNIPNVNLIYPGQRIRVK